MTKSGINWHKIRCHKRNKVPHNSKNIGKSDNYEIWLLVNKCLWLQANQTYYTTP